MSFDAEYGRFKERTPKSASLFDENRILTPYGVHSNYRVHEPYSIFVKRTKGSRIWDADGNEYVDFNLGFGTLIVGHSHPVLVEEPRRAVEEGTMYRYDNRVWGEACKDLM